MYRLQWVPHKADCGVTHAHFCPLRVQAVLSGGAGPRLSSRSLSSLAGPRLIASEPMLRASAGCLDDADGGRSREQQPPVGGEGEGALAGDDGGWNREQQPAVRGKSGVGGRCAGWRRWWVPTGGWWMVDGGYPPIAVAQRWGQAAAGTATAVAALLTPPPLLAVAGLPPACGCWHQCRPTAAGCQAATRSAGAAAGAAIFALCGLQQVLLVLGLAITTHRALLHSSGSSTAVWVGWGG